MEKTTLALHGFNNALIPNTFIKQDSSRLAIIFPGLGYTATMPLLYYSNRVMVSQGADVLEVHYNYNTETFQALSQADQYRHITADATAAYQTVMKQRNYKSVTLIGKSLGTLALGHLLSTQPELSGASFVWLTPLFRDETLHRQVLSNVETATDGESLVFEGANHSLEISGKVLESLQYLRKLVTTLTKFIS